MKDNPPFRTPHSALRTGSTPRSALRTSSVIGLVGGIGSGKSLVARLLAARGGVLIDADALGHAALRDPVVREQVVARFGAEVLGGDGEIVRKKLAAAVFADAGLRRELESWVHPWVGERVAEQIATANADAAVQYVVLDAPVMLEAGWNDICDRIVYVDVPRELRLARLAERGWSAEQLAAREAAQMPLEEKARRADATIDNAGSPEQTARQVDELLRSWDLTR